MCPPQGLTALEPCLETPATPQTRHVCARCRPGRGQSTQASPEQSAEDDDAACTTRRRQLLTLFLPAAIACAVMRDAMDKRRARDK